MPGLFHRLFSPRWQHKDPAVRARAATLLSNDDLKALETLIQDVSPEVRRAALIKIDQPQRLLDWHARYPSAESFERVVDVLSGRITPPVELKTRIALVESLEDADLINALVISGDNQALRLAALARVDEESRLIDHACDNGITAVRRAAAERVTSDAGLVQLARQAKRDKQVARLARERLVRQRADTQQRAAADSERQRLLAALETHAQRGANEPGYEARLKHWVSAWESVPDQASETQRERFAAAVAHCRRRLADALREQREAERLQIEKRQAQMMRESVLEVLAQALHVVRQSDPLTVEAMHQLQNQWRLQGERWYSISEQHGIGDADHTRYETLEKQAQTIWAAWERLLERQEVLREHLDHPTEARDALAQLAWPADLPATALLAQVRREATRTPLPPQTQTSESQPGSQNIVAVDAWLDELTQALDEGRYQPATQVHRRLRHQLKDNDQRLTPEQEPRYKQQTARLAELRDWRGYVAAPKREQLVSAIEALALETGSRDAERHRQHQRLIQQWRQLGDAAATREFAERFRGASDELHTQLASWEAEKSAHEQANLSARDALCEQLEALLEQPASHADPDSLRHIRDAAQAQWEHHWPVPKRRAAALGRRYARLRHRLQALIDSRASDAAERKRELVEQARQLAESDAAPRQRGEQAKALQQQWRALGRAPKGAEQTLWRQFRSHCDAIFAARESVRDEQQARHQRRFDEMQALIDKLDAWKPQRADERQVLDAALQEAQRLTPIPRSRRSEGMEKRWQGIVHARELTLERLELSERASRWPQERDWLIRAISSEPVDAAPELIRSTLTASSTLDSDQAEERLQRALVQLSLLASQPVPQELESLKLEVQVARLNDGLGRPPSPLEELDQVINDLLALADALSPGSWERHASAFNRLMAQFSHFSPRGH